MNRINFSSGGYLAFGGTRMFDVFHASQTHGDHMLDAANITAFIATTDPTRAIDFYRDTLGLRLVSDDAFASVFDCNGTGLRVQKVRELQPHPFTSLGWNVADIRAAVVELSERGVAFERYPFVEQDELGIWQTPGDAKVAWFKDPDGNLLSLTEHGLVPG